MKLRITIGALLALALSLSVFGVALAHAHLESSEPAAGARLSSAPSNITLMMSEEVSEDATQTLFTVTNASGAHVGTGKLDTNDLDHKTISGTLPANLPNGVYTVAWQAVTPDDNGHSDGTFTFGINADAGTQPTVTAHDDDDAAQPTTVAATQPTAAAATTPSAATATTTAPATLPNTGASADGTPSTYVLVAVLCVLLGGVALGIRRRGSKH